MGLMGLGSAQTLVVLIALSTLIISVSVSATAGMVVAGPALLLIGGTGLRWGGVPLLHGVPQRARWGWGAPPGYTAHPPGVTAGHPQAPRLPPPLPPPPPLPGCA